MTPLNAIINKCESVHSKIKKVPDKQNVAETFATIKSEVDVIWASSKAMHLLTTSQLQNYQIDCDKLKPVAFNYKTLGFGNFNDYLQAYLKPFEIKLKTKRV